MTKLDDLKASGEAPDWYSDAAFQTVSEAYLYKQETPKDMYWRVAKSSAKYLKKPELADKFFDLLWKNWLCPSTPVCVNAGLDIGFPIACFSSFMEDSTVSIMNTLKEVALLSKYGGGTAIHMNEVRCKGTPISRGGYSDGIVPFMKMGESIIIGMSQGSSRRGSCAIYIDIEHGDFDDFINSRYPRGDANRQTLNLHHAVCISNAFIQKIKDGNEEARRRWKLLLTCRIETGEPYLFFTDTVNDTAPESFKKCGISIKGSNLCNEIFQPTDKDHTLVCCLSSMNLAKWYEWKDTDAIQLAIWFLDGIMQEFIEKATGKEGFDRAINSAIKSRSLGLGVLGFHSLLQSKGMCIEDLDSYILNNLIFKTIKEQAEIATKNLALEYGEPEWCKDLERRNSVLLAVAPTASNSIISSNVSRGIEPWISNIFAEKSAKGTFVVKNLELMKILEDIGQNTDEVWASINKNDGSVQHLEFLSEQWKRVFLTAREINQFVLVKLAAARQKYIDQGQSLNLFFPANSDPKYVHRVHLEAATSGLKGLYYLRSTSVLKVDQAVAETFYKRDIDECSYCQ